MSIKCVFDEVSERTTRTFLSVKRKITQSQITHFVPLVVNEASQIESVNVSLHESEPPEKRKARKYDSRLAEFFLLKCLKRVWNRTTQDLNENVP